MRCASIVVFRTGCTYSRTPPHKVLPTFKTSGPYQNICPVATCKGSPLFPIPGCPRRNESRTPPFCCRTAGTSRSLRLRGITAQHASRQPSRTSSRSPAAAPDATSTAVPRHCPAHAADLTARRPVCLPVPCSGHPAAQPQPARQQAVQSHPGEGCKQQARQPTVRFAERQPSHDDELTRGRIRISSSRSTAPC